MPDDVPLSLPPRPPEPQGAALFAERVRAWRRDPRAGVAAVVVCAVVAGAFWFRSSLHSSANASVVPPVSTQRSLPVRTTTTTAAATVVVHVAGAVVHPGVVTLPATNRVVDAIRRAGGAQPDADLDRLDLAARLTDGTRIYVPRVGQPAPAVAPGGGDPSSDSGAAASGPIDLNTATQAQLETLPGIGPALAAAIVAERERLGGFSAVDDLRRVRGIGDARFAQLQPLVTV